MLYYNHSKDKRSEREERTMTIIALIISIIALVISTVALIETLPYSDNDTICNLQLKLNEIIGKLDEMK